MKLKDQRDLKKLHKRFSNHDTGELSVQAVTMIKRKEFAVTFHTGRLQQRENELKAAGVTNGCLVHDFMRGMIISDLNHARDQLTFFREQLNSLQRYSFLMSVYALSREHNPEFSLQL